MLFRSVTFEGEQKLLQWQNENAGRSGASGDLTRLSISRAERIGKFQGWKEMRSVIQLAVIKGY